MKAKTTVKQIFKKIEKNEIYVIEHIKMKTSFEYFSLIYTKIAGIRHFVLLYTGQGKMIMYNSNAYLKMYEPNIA